MTQKCAVLREGRTMLSLRELLSGICLRPQMYVANGSFAEVAAFIDGFEAGRFADRVLSREMDRF